MDVGIVGAGVGGLTTALLLSKQGVKVHLYEKGKRLGGRLAYQEGGGFRVDQGPTIVLLPELLLDILEEAGIERSRIPLIECDPLYRIHYADGTVLHKRRHTDEQVKELDRTFPGQSAAFKRYIRDMGQAFVQGKAAFLDRPFLSKSEFFTTRNMRLLVKLKALRSVRSVAARYFRDEKLIDAFSLQTLYIGGAPFRSPGLYALLPYAEHAFGVWYVKGGYAGLVPMLERELEQRGVTIHKEAEIQRLQLEGGKCTGLVVGNELRRHAAVVYNGDFPHLDKLLSSGRASKAARAFVPSSGCVLIYLGLNRQWPEALAHQFFLPPSLTQGLKLIFEQNKLPDDPSFYVFYPTAIDAAAAPAGQSVMCVLIPSPSARHRDWVAAVPELVDRVIAEAERRGFPGLRDAIVWQSVRTPADAEAEGLYQGGSFGIAPILAQSALYRPQIVPYPIKGLYAVGASVHPGGGVPIVMQGARLLARHMSKEMIEWN